MSEPILKASGLSRRYRTAQGTIQVLDQLDLEVQSGEAVAVIGDSGVGKSTLLHILGGIDRPDNGSLEYRNEDVLGFNVNRLALFRNREIGFVFQSHYLLPEFTALENVAMPFRIAGDGDGAGVAREILSRLGLKDRLHHYPGELSGGEQQRVAVARAIAREPAVVLADEPTGNLDPGTGGAVFDTLLELQREASFGLVLATHSGRLAGQCDRVLRLKNGSLGEIHDSELSSFFAGEETPWQEGTASKPRS
jgi:lipoprotein-releasing system ATP-binding protein